MQLHLFFTLSCPPSLGGHDPTYRFATVEIEQEDGTAFALEQLARLGHDLRHQTLEVVLLGEDVPGEIEQYLVAPVLLDGHFEQLRILDADAAERKVTAEDLDIALGKLR